MNERKHTIETDFYHKDLRCVVIMGTVGTRCGYVGVHKDSVLYGKDYNETIPIKIKELRGQPVGKRNSIDLFSMALKDEDENINIGYYFDVHGGLTYSGKGDYPVKSDLWWFGYDCAHAGDAKDLSKLTDKEKEFELKFSMPNNEIHRTLEYCVDECKSLANQIEVLENTLNL